MIRKNQCGRSGYGPPFPLLWYFFEWTFTVRRSERSCEQLWNSVRASQSYHLVELSCSRRSSKRVRWNGQRCGANGFRPSRCGFDRSDSIHVDRPSLEAAGIHEQVEVEQVEVDCSPKRRERHVDLLWKANDLGALKDPLPETRLLSEGFQMPQTPP